MRPCPWIRIVAWAPALAVLAQLLLATAVAAASGGSDFPLWRR
ncbi:MAG TPA: hypothetical protein VF367_07660 [Candidatus Limnocylindria bacterium]